MRFATRMLLVQVATVAGVVVVCSLVFGWLGIQQLQTASEQSALNIARTLAADPEVRQRVAAYSADSGTPAADLRDGELQQVATRVTARTGALFVVITDDHGIRLAHPNRALLGKPVSTSFADALAGREVVTWETGTLGESARAKVPVVAPAGGRPVGEVSVGFERGSVFGDLPLLLGGIGLAAAAALLLALGATIVVRRRFERMTLGLQPEELVALVQNQAAVLEGVGDGVIAADPGGTVRVCNGAAARLLGLTEPIGRSVGGLGLPPAVLAEARTGVAVAVVVGERVLYADVRPVVRGGRDLGEVIVLRDRTDVEALAARLETVRTMTEALRVQRHEFANRLHVAVGLLDADRTPDARSFLGELVSRGAVDHAIPGVEHVPDPFLQAFLGAKADAARERGVQLRISDDTLMTGTVGAAEDVAAILGNLIDNAVRAAHAAGADPWVEIGLFGDRADLVLTVADSGAGVGADIDPFAVTERAPDPDAVHGRGFGLRLARDLARRRDGDLWLIDRGGAAGAVFGARVPGALAAPAVSTEEDT